MGSFKMNPAIQSCSAADFEGVKMKKILLTNRYEGEPLRLLQSAIAGRYELRMLDEVSQEDLLEKIPEADFLLVSGRLKITPEVIEKAKKLLMVQRTGVGLDNIDLEYLSQKGVPLYVNRGVNADSVAEYAVFLMLEVLRRAYAVNVRLRKGIWEKQKTGLMTHELRGRTVGIIGMGKIGKRTAELLSVFHVRLLYYDVRRLAVEEEQQYHVSYCEFDQLLRESDILTLHCSMNQENRYLISSDELCCMKDGSILINTARGGLVDTKALAEALESGKLMGAGIDTFEEEPVSGDNPLLSLENAVLSPHIGGVTCEAFARMMELALKNISMFDAGNYETIAANRVI